MRNDFTIEHNAYETINMVITLYEKIFEDTTIKEEYPMQQFFDNRIDSRLTKWYNDEELFTIDVQKEIEAKFDELFGDITENNNTNKN